MKLLKKLSQAAMLIAVLSFVACTDDDNNNGGGTNTPQGSFTGDFTGGDGTMSTWTAGSVTCLYDTILDVYIMTATNGTNDEITIVLSSDNNQTYTFNNLSSNVSTYEQSGSSDIATTETNDVDGVSSGFLQVTTPDMENATAISGDFTMPWYFVGPEIDDDVLSGVIQNGEFVDVAVTRGTSLTFNDAELSCTIDGTPFAPTFVTSAVLQGITIQATNAEGESISISLPEDAEVGEHTLSFTSDYTCLYNTAADIFFSESGTINITAIDNDAGTATGTFEFTGSDFGSGGTVEVTNGTFSVE